MCDLFSLLEAIVFTSCADEDTRFVSNATHGNVESCLLLYLGGFEMTR